MKNLLTYYGDIVVIIFIIGLISLCIKVLIDNKKNGNSSCGMNCTVCSCGNCFKKEELKKKLKAIN